MKFKYILTNIILFFSASIIYLNAQSAGFSVTPATANVSENGGMISIYVVLNSAPSSDVVLDVISSNVDNVIVSTSSFVFTPVNWNKSQAIVATGINDDFNRDGDNSTVLIAVNASLSNPIYGVLADQSVVITCLDDETSIKNQIDFNTTDQLTDLFNPDSSPVFTNISDQGINNSGAINVPLGTSDIWTYKKGFSVSSDESSVYTFSAFFKILGENGRGGLGFTNNPFNEPDNIYGAPLTGLGMTFHGGGGEFVNNRGITYVGWPPGLAVGNWYKMIFKITSNAGSDNFDVEFWIYNASADGNIGSLYSNKTGSFTNATMASSDVIYVYFSSAGTRMEKIDNYEFEIEGATSIVEEGHPVVLGYEVNSITTNSISAGGNVTSDGGTFVNERGIVFASDPTPTINSNKIVLDDGLGLFSANINNLEPNTTYFVRAYATNGTGTSYGAEKIVTTLGTPSIKISKTTIDVDENSGTNTVLVSLGGQPASNVTINSVLNNTSEASVSTASLNFDPGTWDIPQVITITGINDNEITVDTAELTLSVDMASSDDAYDVVVDSKVGIILINDDLDTDNDMVNDDMDQCAATPIGETVDANGCSDSQKDTDNDGVTDDVDQCQSTPAGETINGDGCSITQIDDDNDGVTDDLDKCPDTPTGETVDVNGCSAFQIDTDGDGSNDDDDAFPNDPDEDTDSDGDGTGDNADAFPNGPDEDTDSDGDGTGDNADAFPNDANEDMDSDGDGTGDTEDTDDDNDGILDVDDSNPLNALTDTDGDGTGDNADTDDDNDGVLDKDDAFPLDANEGVDTDGDGIGDNADSDDDGDSVSDTQDAFPLEALEGSDADNDGIGDNEDADDDNDGVVDGNDDFPTDSEPMLIPAQAFTPNGDGNNDTWVIPGIDNYPNNKVSVYNRWGHLVFEANGYGNNWEGFYKQNSEKLPQGSYLYVIDLSEGEVPLRGWIFINY